LAVDAATAVQGPPFTQFQRLKSMAIVPAVKLNVPFALTTPLVIAPAGE
jgi:hypothetical protein